MARTITRWDPFAELADMRSRFDRMLGEFGDGHDWAPAIDVVREDERLVVRAEVPGVKPEEIEVKAEGGILTISGKHEESSETKEDRFVRRERRYGAFARSLALPEGADASKIEATTHDGVLEVFVPLPQEAAQEAVTITPTAG
jgi:HSP20 family protein